METRTNTNVDVVNTSTRNTENEIYFDLSYSALKLLGKNLYSNAANAISELVANSIDAHAKSIYVYIDMSKKKQSIVEIIDDGYGMNYSDLAEKYVWIGRNKRIDESISDEDKKTLMGRKGIGKLAALFLSDQYYIITKKTNETSENRWKVDLKQYSDSDIPRLDRIIDPVHLVNEEIWNGFNHGTVIRLNNVDLRRNGEKRIEALRRVFADFYLLDAIRSTIFVAVKTSDKDSLEFKPVEKKIAYKNFYALFDNSGLDIASKMSKSIAFTWASKYEHIANKLRQTQLLDGGSYKTKGTKCFTKEDGSSIEKEYELIGWIGIHSTIEQGNAVDENFIRNNIYQPNKLRLYVRNKVAVENYFNINPSTQTMSNYIEGEISFDILDDDDLPDIATSSREDFMEDERIELLVSIVDPIINSLFGLRNRIGKIISDENEEYEEKLRKEEEDARKAAESAAQESERKRIEEEEKRKKAEAEAERERQRSQYIIDISGVEDKNILNTVHSIYNMSCRVKENLDDLSNLISWAPDGRKKLEKASISNQKVLSMSKIIAKGGHVVDNNDALQKVDLVKFIVEYTQDVLTKTYRNNISIKCIGDTETNFITKIKPLSFVMILDNIIGNAIKAHATAVLIIVQNTSSDTFRLLFKDNGDGIDQSVTDLNRLYEFGFTTTNGSGLGLYYAKKHMTELKGNVEIIQNSDKGISVVLNWKK